MTDLLLSSVMSDWGLVNALGAAFKHETFNVEDKIQVCDINNKCGLEHPV